MDDDAYGKPKLGNLKKRSRNQLDNGKRKRPNSHPGQDHGSGTPKAIETLYRILCPGKKIGSVLGKGGEIVNALRDETHAKIRVADAIPGADERVVIIFNYSKESGKGDGDQDPENAPVHNDLDEIRPHCPAQHALLKVHDRIAADEYLRGGVVHEKADPDDTVTARILVPSNQVGCLLGKGGTVIQKLRSDYTGANIRVLPSEHLPPCAMSTDELVQISGTPMVVKKALYDISTRLHQHPRKDNPPIDDLIYASTQGLVQPASVPPPPHGIPVWPNQQRDTYGTPPRPWFEGYRNEAPGFPPSSYNSSHSGNDGETPEEFSMRVLCPTEKIGGVIGKAGANVRQLEHDTQARIQVEDTPPEAEERIINVSSREGPWDRISPTIEAVLQLQSRTSAATEDGTVTTRLLVPSSKVGCLLGQGGNIITEMRRRTRADIRVYSKEDKPKYTSANEELVQISGNRDVAREALLEIASRLRMRTFRSGNAPVNPAPVFPDRGFTPPERMSARGLPPSHMRGAPENPAPVYPAHGFAPPRESISSRGPLFPPYESISSRGPPFPPYESISSRGLPSSNIARAGNNFDYEFPKRPEPVYTAQGYPPVPPPGAAGYSSMTSTMEIKIPSTAVPSVLGVGGSNISDIRQISGARVKLQDPLPGSSDCVVEIYGTSEQLKAAQSLLQAFVASGGQNAAQPLGPSEMQAPFYRRY